MARSSKADHQYVAEVESLKSANAALTMELKDAKRETTSTASLQSTIRHLEAERRFNQKLEAQLGEVRGELTSARATADGLQARHTTLQAEAENLKVTIQNLRHAEAERDCLEETVEMAAIAYRRAWKAWQADMRKLEEALTEARWEAAAWQSTAESSAMALQAAKEDARILRARLRVASEEREVLQSGLEHHSAATRPDAIYLNDNIPPLPTLDLSLPILALTVSHIDLARERTTWLQEDNGELASEAANASTAARHAEAVEASLRASYAELQTEHAALRNAHEPCESQKAQLQAQITLANQAEGDARLELGEMCARVSAAEQRAKEDRETLKRANDATVRSRAAQTGLEDELQQ